MVSWFCPILFEIAYLGDILVFIYFLKINFEIETIFLNNDIWFDEVFGTKQMSPRQTI